MRYHRNPRKRLAKPPSADNPTTGRSINIILDVLRTVDRRRAMRLVEAVAAFVSAATREPKGKS